MTTPPVYSYSPSIDDPSGGPAFLAYFQQKFAQPCPKEKAVLNEEEWDLIERIRESFKDVRLEDGIGLMQAEAKDYYACEEIQDFLAQHEERDDWSSLTASHLNACSCALSYVDAKGFRFLIPALVIHDIKGLLGSSDPHHSLTYNLHPDPKSNFPDFDEKKFLADKCELLSEAQQSALQEYIRYYRFKNEDYRASLWDTEEELMQMELEIAHEAKNAFSPIPSTENWIRYHYLMDHSVFREETTVLGIDRDEKEWLLRFFPEFTEDPESINPQKLVRKQEEIRINRALAEAGIPILCPVETGNYRNKKRLYILQPWAQGAKLRTMDLLGGNARDHDYYRLGVDAGKILKAIHSTAVLPADTGCINDLLRKELDQRLHERNSEEPDTEKEERALRYVNEHLSELPHSPALFLHGNYTTDNLMLDVNDQLLVTDLRLWQIGEGARDFSTLMLYPPFPDSARSISFAQGQIDGYCDGKPTEYFFRRVAFYTAFHLAFYRQFPSAKSGYSFYTPDWVNLAYPEEASLVPAWYSGKVY